MVSFKTNVINLSALKLSKQTSHVTPCRRIAEGYKFWPFTIYSVWDILSAGLDSIFTKIIDLASYFRTARYSGVLLFWSIKHCEILAGQCFPLNKEGCEIAWFTHKPNYVVLSCLVIFPDMKRRANLFCVVCMYTGHWVSLESYVGCFGPWHICTYMSVIYVEVEGCVREGYQLDFYASNPVDLYHISCMQCTQI